jgi:hypothetical protein
MTNEIGYQLCVQRLREDVALVKEKLADGVDPIEVAGRIAIGYMSDDLAKEAAPGLLAVALILLTTAEVL